MNTWAVVPIKPLDRAKSRLGAVLSASQRAELVRCLFQHTLQVLCGWEALSGIVVVSASLEVREVCDLRGVLFLPETEAIDLNRSLESARQMVLQKSADCLMIVAGDIPGLNRPSLRRLLNRAENGRQVVIAPDGEQQGTNVMVLTPPGLIPFCYGPGSFQQHQQQAGTIQASFDCVLDASLSFDVDTPSDLEILHEQYAGQFLIQTIWQNSTKGN